MARRDLGVTLVEVLVSAAIVAVLAGLTFGAALLVKERSAVAVCTSNLRQLHGSLVLYRADWDGEGRYGDMHVMGLPDARASAPNRFWQVHKGLRCPLAPKPWPHGGGRYLHLWQPEKPSVKGSGYRESWAAHAASMGERSVVFVDINHNPSDMAWANPTVPKRSLGIRLDGSFQNVLKPGFPDTLAFWETQD